MELNEEESTYLINILTIFKNGLLKEKKEIEKQQTDLKKWGVERRHTGTYSDFLTINEIKNLLSQFDDKDNLIKSEIVKKQSEIEHVDLFSEKLQNNH